MNIPWWAWLVVAALLFAVYLRSLAGRLDRLHVRLEAARGSLDAALARRDAAATELAASGVLDPASSMLVADAAHDARESDDDRRSHAESDLSKALRAALDDDEVAELQGHPMGVTLLSDLQGASTRVTLARRFHNDAVDATLQLRNRPLVRTLRLAGTAPWPQSFDMDDAPPGALVH